MKLKFKTVYEGKLIDCYLVDELVFVDAILLCRYETDIISCANLRVPLKDAPVFQYIGKKDINDEEIYCGHQLVDENVEKDEKPKEYTVIWEEMVSGFALLNQWNQLFSCDQRVNYMKIIGHSALEKK